jgi:hypothetical protein
MAFGRYAIDCEQRIDFPRLRPERVARVKTQVKEDGIGAIITWDPDNIRHVFCCYVTAPTPFGERSRGSAAISSRRLALEVCRLLLCSGPDRSREYASRGPCR